MDPEERISSLYALDVTTAPATYVGWVRVGAEDEHVAVAEVIAAMPELRDWIIARTEAGIEAAAMALPASGWTLPSMPIAKLVTDLETARDATEP